MAAAQVINNGTYLPQPIRPGPPISALPNQQNGTTIIVMVEAEDQFIHQKLEVLNWVVTVLAAVVVGLRMHNKYRRAARLWWDDWIAIVSLTILLALAISLRFEIQDGVGKHVTELTPAELEMFNLTDQLSSTIAIVVTSLAKTGFAVTLLKISEGRLRTFVWAIIGVVNIVSGVSGTLIWVQCQPLRKNFEPLSFGSCFPGQVRIAIPITNTAVSGTADIALSLLALYLVHRKTMKLGYWIGALFCATFGIFAGITSYFKAGVMHVLVGDDITFDIVPLVVWGIVEPALLLIAGSLPELRHYVWKHPKPVRYRAEEFNYRPDGFTDAEYEFARQQYAAAGQKTFGGQAENERNNTLRHKLWI